MILSFLQQSISFGVGFGYLSLPAGAGGGREDLAHRILEFLQAIHSRVTTYLPFGTARCIGIWYWNPVPSPPLDPAVVVSVIAFS